MMDVVNYLMLGECGHWPISSYDPNVIGLAAEYINDFFAQGDGWNSELFADEAESFLGH